MMNVDSVWNTSTSPPYHPKRKATEMQLCDRIVSPMIVSPRKKTNTQRQLKFDDISSGNSMDKMSKIKDRSSLFMFGDSNVNSYTFCAKQSDALVFYVNIKDQNFAIPDYLRCTFSKYINNYIKKSLIRYRKQLEKDRSKETVLYSTIGYNWLRGNDYVAEKMDKSKYRIFTKDGRQYVEILESGDFRIFYSGYIQDRKVSIVFFKKRSKVVSPRKTSSTVLELTGLENCMVQVLDDIKEEDIVNNI